MSMYDEDRYTKGKRVNNNSIFRKEKQKMKKLQKEQERLSRTPSCRLGKEEKKQTARRNIILDMRIEKSQPSTAIEKPFQKRVVLSKQKRKEGHRDLTRTRIEQTDHLEGLDPEQFNDIHYDDGFSWGRYMAEISDEAHKKRRQRERLAKSRAILENERLLIQEASYWRAASTNFIGRGDLDDDDL